MLVIAAGGGGIPLAAGPAGPAGDGAASAGRSLRTALADAVIDKDRAAGLLATLIGAQALLLVTAVDRVMLDYGTPQQSGLGSVTADEMARHLDEGYG